MKFAQLSAKSKQALSSRQWFSIFWGHPPARVVPTPSFLMRVMTVSVAGQTVFECGRDIFRFTP
jgi:hypothetical protein